MVSHSYLIRLAAVAVVASAAPLPLNINTGAYSPALVVGDGAIEFKGGENGVERIMNSLQGAAVSGAAAAAANIPQTQAPVQASIAPGILNEQASLPIPGSTKELGPRDDQAQEEDEEEDEEEAAPTVQKRQNGFDRALTFAEAALSKGPKIQLGTGEGGAGVGVIVDNNINVAALPGKGTRE